MTPLVSVIIPAHNAARFLPDAIASLRQQRDLALDIIVIDDGSTDETAQVAASLGADVRVLHTDKIGPAAARNRGIAAARGDYFAFLDADDWFPPDSLTARAARLESDPALGIAGGYIQLITLLGADAVMAHDPTRVRNVPYLNVNLGAYLYRRTAFERVGGFDESLFYAEDVDWHLRAQRADVRLAILRAVTLGYRRHPTNVTVPTAAGQIALVALGVMRRESGRRGVTVTMETLNQHFAASVDPADAPPPPISVIVYVDPACVDRAADSLASVHAQIGLAARGYPDLDVIIVGADAESIAGRCGGRAILGDPHDPAACRNVGIAAARGAVIAFIDAGDVWVDDKLVRQVEHLRTYPFVQTIVGYAESDALTQGAPPLWGVPISALVARRTAFEQIGLFDPTYPLAHAADWFTRALDANLPRALPNDVLVRLYRPPIVSETFNREIARLHLASLRRRQHEKGYRSS
jgi:glycosyltransferase involved in cell wall biosynthesis